MWAKLKPAARGMRHEPTPAENLLWQRLRGHRLNGHGFRRQHPLDRFLADFYCPDRNLVIEIDGPIHDQSNPEDAARQAHLEGLGYRVIRFKNQEILQSMEHVLAKIAMALEKSTLEHSETGLPEPLAHQ
ncbi:MAG: endonuclease domain-containing protein [SAR324 cluster bacterium]|nr:endonuclease domain-containing protein [SAR324 cluster bacterium]